MPAHENPDLAKTFDASPGIEDKMNAAQSDIVRFNFGVAGGKQRAVETALQNIIKVLSRRRTIDQKLLNEIAAAKKQAQENLDKQRELTKQTKAIEDKQDLQKHIAEAKQQLNELRSREQALRQQTQALNGAENPEALALDAALDAARKDLEKLVAEQTAQTTATKDALSDNDKDLSVSLSSLEEIETAQRKLAARSEVLGKQPAAKSASPEARKTEHEMVTIADEQADLRAALDKVTARLAAVAAAVKNFATPEPKVEKAGKAADAAIMTLKDAETAMNTASDTLRKGSAVADVDSAAAGAKQQIVAAEIIAKARASLNQSSTELSEQDQAPALTAAAGKQRETEAHATDLQKRLSKLGADIDKAHAAASGALKSKEDSGAAAAAEKIGEATGSMKKASDELSKTSAASAASSQAKSADGSRRSTAAANQIAKRRSMNSKIPPNGLAKAQSVLKKTMRASSPTTSKVRSALPQNPARSQSQRSRPARLEQHAERAEQPRQCRENAAAAVRRAQGRRTEFKERLERQGRRRQNPTTAAAARKNDGGKPDLAERRSTTEGAQRRRQSQIRRRKARRKSAQRSRQSLERARRSRRQSQPKKATITRPMHSSASRPTSSPRAKMSRSSRATQRIRRQNRQRQSQESQPVQPERRQQTVAGLGSARPKNSKDGAQQAQEQSEDELKDVLDNLDELQKQVQDQTRKEKLFQIEEALKKMLDTQKTLLQRTIEVDKNTIARAKKGMTQQIFKEQLSLSDASRVIVKQLEEAAVFQWVLQTAVDDMTEAAARLDKEKTGVATQEIQDDAAKKIADLIEALRKERTKPNPGGGGGGGGGKQPLVPPVAQLKMLLIMQKDVDTRTRKIDDELKKSPTGEMDKELRERQRRSAVKEGDIARITAKIAAEFEGPQQQAPQTPDQNGDEGKKDQ